MHVYLLQEENAHQISLAVARQNDLLAALHKSRAMVDATLFVRSRLCRTANPITAQQSAQLRKEKDLLTRRRRSPKAEQFQVCLFVMANSIVYLSARSVGWRVRNLRTEL